MTHYFLNHTAGKLKTFVILSIFLICNILSIKIFAQAPTISYNSPQTYTTGTAITPLAPTISNPVAINTSFNHPAGIATDAAGNVYIADTRNNAIKKIPAGGGAAITIGSGFTFPLDVAVDAAGNVYVANFGDNTKKIPVGGGPPVTVGSGGSCIAVDAAGNIYETSFGSTSVMKTPAGGGAVVNVGSGFSDARGLATDAAGNVYVADRANNAVKEIPVGGGPIITLGSGFSGPLGVAVDAAGNVYVADSGNNALKEIPAGGGAPILFGTVISAYDVAVDGSGNVYVTDNNFSVKEIKPITSYSISPALPAGLSFNTSSGVIAGTPAIVSAAANYTITANYNSGSTTAIVNIKTVAPPPIVAGLASGAIAACAGSPSASPYIEQFTVSGNNLSADITVTAPAGFEVSVASGTGFGSSVILTQSGGNVNNTIIYVRSAASATGIISGNVALTSTGSPSQNVAVTGIVKTIPTVSPVANQTVENGATIPAINFTASDGVSWVNNSPGIGLSAFGSGNIASFNAINTGISPVTATITATPVSLGIAYVINSGSNNVSVINTVTNTIITTIPVGTNPQNAVVSPDGTLVYVTNLGSNNISVINTTSNTVTNTIQDIGAGPGNLVISPDGSRLYIINSINTISVVNTLTKVLVASVGVGNHPNGIAISPDGSKVYVANANTATVSVINTSTNTIASTITLKVIATSLAISSDGSLLSATDDQGPGGVSIINTITNNVGFSLANIGSGARTSIFSPDGTRLYVANVTSTNIAVINTATQLLITFIPLSKTPAGMSVSFDGTRLFVANSAASGSMSTINMQTNTVLSTTAAGSSPNAVVNRFAGGQMCTGTPATFTITILSNVPKISYTGPQVYTVNTAITPLTPSNSGAPVPPVTYGQTTTLAGSGAAGAANGTGTAASFRLPWGVATDAAGNIYVAELTNDLIRKITPAGVVTTLAGSGSGGSVNGTGTAASFRSPAGIAIDATGNLYVADENNHMIRKITPAGVVTTLAGSGTPGATNGTGTAASFHSPLGVAVDRSGNVYVADQGNHLIRKITSAGVVTTLAGNGFGEFSDGTGTAAAFHSPVGVAVDNLDNVYVADLSNYRIRKITPAGVVTTLAGSGLAGAANGSARTASFNQPYGVSLDKAGNVFVADKNNNMIRKVLANGTVSSLAGSGTAGAVNGTGAAVTFNQPTGVAVDSTGNVYVADQGNNLVRKVTVFGYTISPALPAGLSFDSPTGTISGTPTAVSPATNYTITAYNSGGGSATILSITISPPSPLPSISYDSPQTYSAGTPIPSLTPVNSGGAVPSTIHPGNVSTFAGSGTTGAVNGTGIAASFSSPYGAAVDSAGNIYIADQGNNMIRKITPGAVVTTLAGAGTAGAANGTGTSATFNGPRGVAVDGSGNIYVADQGNAKIRKITPAGVVTTFAGSGLAGSANGTAATASFHNPYGVAADGSGNIYVADFSNNLIRKITQAGIVSTFAGSGSPGSVNGTGTSATFNGPRAVAVDGTGNVYVADYGNNLIRKITPAGVVSTFAGSGAAGFADGVGTAATFKLPTGVTVDAMGNVYVTDTGYGLTRWITPGGLVTTISNSSDGGPGFFSLGGLAVSAGNLYLADINVQKVMQVNLMGYYIDHALPTGLSFNNTTGVIQGTPGAVSPATNYIITAYNSAGSDTATLNIKVATQAGHNVITQTFDSANPYGDQLSGIPEPNIRQAISPNGDGINDVLTIDNIQSYPDNKLTLMDRNGAEVYQMSGYNNVSRVFDGHSNINRKMQLPGTYFYMLEYKTNGELKRKTGYFILKY